MATTPPAFDMTDWYRENIYQPFSLTREGARTGALLVHGFTGSPADMRASAELIHARGVDVHVMRLPGMASEIDHINEMSAPVWREAVLARWAEVRSGYDRTILLGYSMGGALALHGAAHQRPDLLVLVAPLVRIATRVADALPVAKRVVRHIRPFAYLHWDDPRVHDWFHRVMPAIDTVDPAIQTFLRTGAVASTAMLDELRVLARDALRLAPKVTTRTVVVQGVDDRIVLPRHSRLLVRKLGGMVSYREVAGDHFIPLPSFETWPNLARVLEQELELWDEDQPLDAQHLE